MNARPFTSLATILLLVPMVAACTGTAASPSGTAGQSLRLTASPLRTPTPPATPTASPTGKSGTFTATGTPAAPPPDPTANHPNDDASMALLKDGDVLYLGYSGAQLYDPASGKFRETGPPLTSSGYAFDPLWSDEAMTLGDGRVLVLGGDAQVYDRATGNFTRTGETRPGGGEGAAVLLHDERVLAMGQDPDNWAGAECDIWDSTTGKFSPTGSMKTARAQFTATVLQSGRVLVAGGMDDDSGGGSDFSSAELYNPATGKWTKTGSMTEPRYRATATLLPSGKVLIAGGDDDEADDSPVATAELYDPATGRFTKTGSMSVARDWATAILLRDGRVLVAGGGTEDMDTRAAEIYDPSTGKFTVTGSMSAARSMNPSILLPDGRVLVVGSGSADLYWP